MAQFGTARTRLPRLTSTPQQPARTHLLGNERATCAGRPRRSARAADRTLEPSSWVSRQGQSPGAFGGGVCLRTPPHLNRRTGHRCTRSPGKDPGAGSRRATMLAHSNKQSARCDCCGIQTQAPARGHRGDVKLRSQRRSHSLHTRRHSRRCRRRRRCQRPPSRGPSPSQCRRRRGALQRSR